MSVFKCNTCKFYKGGSRCECCFENEHYEEDKYRWHNLRKNPEDLPLWDNSYLCCIEVINPFKEGSRLIREYTVMNRPTILRYKESVIAWGEIEPFEEVEE